ncbi:MAG: septation ring formation regulator EzrA, partial [Bacilli bacterium]|nr:septation ring formation regulator EzrA [Bacilli bacterium]
MPVPIIVLIIVASVLVLAAAILLYFTVFAHSRVKRTANELIAKFEKAHATLFGQDSQYIKRLETISSMNITYIDTYIEWNKRFKDVRDIYDNKALASTNIIKDLLADRRYKELKANLPDFRDIIDVYVKNVENLDRNLQSKFRDEEECRQLLIHEREIYRNIKTDYFTRQGDMNLVLSTFDKLYHKLDAYFELVDQNIDNARYSDATTLLKEKIAPVLNQIVDILKILPGICIQITTVLPEKISNLNIKYDEMIGEDYQLSHIILREDITKMQSQLKIFADDAKAMKLQGLQGQIDKMAHSIDEINAKFHDEINARKEFELGKDATYIHQSKVQKSFVNIKHHDPEIRSIFLFGDAEQAMMDNLGELIERTTNTRSNLDSYINSITKTPYTILLKTMEELRDQTEEADKAIEEYNAYLLSLKNDSEYANKMLSQYFNKLRLAEKDVRDMNIPVISERFSPQFERIYSLID